MLIQTREQFDSLMEVLQGSPRIAVDTETYYINDKKEVPLLIGVAVHGYDGETELSAYLPFRHEHDPTLFGEDKNLPLEWLDELGKVFVDEEKQLVLHNAKFDLKVFEKDGIFLKGKIFDTLLIHYMVDEYPPHSLEALSKVYFPEDVKDQGAIKKVAESLGTGLCDCKEGCRAKTHAQANGWHKIPPFVMEEYASRDARLTYRLLPLLWNELKLQEMTDLWDEEEEFIFALKSAEEIGIGMNINRAKTLAYETQVRQSEILNELEFDPGKAKLLAEKLFAPAPVGLGFQPPTQRRKDGLPVLDESALSRYDHPVVDLVLEYRGNLKALSTWYLGFLEVVWPDGRVHPDFIRASMDKGTVTTRLSCPKPNVQQLPKVDEEKREHVFSMFQATEGFELWEFDYSQAEFRLGGCYSFNHDPSIAEAYKQGVDFHQLTADKLGIPRGREGGSINGKDTNFMMLYGAGPRKVSSKFFNSQDAESVMLAKEIIDNWWAAYPGLKHVAVFSEQAAKQRGYVKFWSGRRRHFKWPSEAYKAFNSIMQGGVAEIVKRSMIMLWKEEYRVCSQVHDAVWIEIPEGQSDIYVPKIKAIMEWPSKEFPIEFPVDAKRLA